MVDKNDNPDLEKIAPGLAPDEDPAPPEAYAEPGTPEAAPDPQVRPARAMSGEESDDRIQRLEEQIEELRELVSNRSDGTPLGGGEPLLPPFLRGGEGLATLDAGSVGQTLSADPPVSMAAALLSAGNAAGFGKAYEAWTTDGLFTGDSSYVMVNPCDYGGTVSDETSELKVYLPRGGKGEDPNVQIGNVIPYWEDEEGNLFNPFTLDGKVGYSTELWRNKDTIKQGWSLVADATGRLLKIDNASPETQEGTEAGPPYETGQPDDATTDSIDDATTSGPTGIDYVDVSSLPTCSSGVSTSDHTHEHDHTHETDHTHEVDPLTYSLCLIARTS